MANDEPDAEDYTEDSVDRGENNSSADYGDDDEEEKFRHHPDDEDLVDTPPNDDNESLEFDYEALWYIKLRGEDDKRPAEKWGGYDQDFEAAACVYSHADVVESDHEYWGVCGIQNLRRMRRELFIIDLDAYKAEDPEAAVESLSLAGNVPVVRSQSGGLHVWFSITADKGAFNESGFELHADLEFDIDIRGSAVSHHVVAPADIPGVNGSYELVNDRSIHNKLTVEDVCAGVRIAGDPVVEYSPNHGFGGGNGGSGYTPNGEEWLLENDVQDALSHVPADLHYVGDADTGGWRDICFAVADYYARTGGPRDDAVETILDWSKTAPDAFDDKTERTAWNIVKAGFDSVEKDDDGRVTLGTLLSVASANGWEWPDVRERKAYARCRAFIEEWPVVERRGEAFDKDEFDDAVKEVASALIPLSNEHYNNVVEDIVHRTGTSLTRIDAHRMIGRAVEKRGSEAFHHQGELVAASKPKGSPWYSTTTLLNFRLDVDSLLDVEGENRMAQVHVTPTEQNESEFDLAIEPRTFNDARRFKDTVLAERFSTVIEAPMHDNDVMDLIRQYIASLNVPTRVGQYEMGLSEDGSEFVTPNGTLTSSGWTDDPDHVHVERGSKTNATVRAFSASPESHSEVDVGDVARMIELVAQSREPESMAAVLGWFYAAPHRPRITNQTGQFNPMNVTGRSGAGKTASLAALSQMFGMDTEPQSCEASKHATLTAFTSSRGVPVWFDEYRPEKIPDYVIDRFHTYYKKAATGGVEPRGTQSMGTVDWHLRSPVVVSGESEIRNSAERRRTVNVTLTKKPTRDGHPAKKAFKALVGDVTVDEDGNVQFPDANYDLQSHAVAYYAHITGMSQEEFDSAWFSARETVAELLNKWGDNVDLGDTEIQALQTVVFGYRCMASFAQTVGADLSTLPSTGDLETALALIADVDGDGRQPQEHQFLSLVSRGAAADYLEADTDYRVVHKGKVNEVLRVNVTRAFDKVSKFVRDHDLNEDLLQSATDYKNRFDQLDEEDTFVTETRQNTPPINRCTGIDMARAVEEVVGFARESFLEKETIEMIDNLSEVADDDDDEERDVLRLRATPLNRLEMKRGGFATFTVEVVEWGESPDAVVEADGPIMTGSVRDETNRKRMVMFDRDKSGVPGGIDHLEAGANVVIRNAPVTEYKNAQIQLDGGTEIESIQAGVGYTEGAARADGQSSLNGETATDGGNEIVNDDDGESVDRKEPGNVGESSQRDRVKSIKSLVDELDDGDGARVDEVRERAGELGISENKFDHHLGKLKTEGVLYDPCEGRVMTI